MKKMVSDKVISGLLVAALIFLLLSVALTASVLSNAGLLREKTVVVDNSGSKQQASVGIIIAPSAQTPNLSGEKNEAGQ